MASFNTITFEHKDRVALVTLNRPESLNALNAETMAEIAALFAELDRHPEVAVTVLTGEGRAFAAGADIKEMGPQTFSDVYLTDMFAGWDGFAASRKPIIAAVNGFALGGGCELAMMCDLIIASDKAKFGQPEIKLGVTPGMGGSIRLTKAVGKAKAMDMVLTGRMIDAAEADRIGLVSRVVPHDTLMEEAMKAASEIASYSLPSLMAAKEMVGRALELPTTEGVRFERRLFQGLFGTKDQKEGMEAFTEKRAPKFIDA
ncbi:enoyl-CoA hydratase-related protein [Hyphomonas chukchiensis]|uniref:enoyl-CoA hydratase n=1 Tax=Hyphomonas chukchiensis TaxID=1280947 RepID=A0A062UHD8_9PROT|nr:enoyl-CoA hydratase-related protein [Hyphomonas chukchiensis]KCZ57702.1 enoyl-CoA hydratase [Hyphomonas chukchiensis]|tara:strand:+ start:2993 stop:3769 length:777 start_codon:yes stop_codon:yes gene_type:complete